MFTSFKLNNSKDALSASVVGSALNNLMIFLAVGCLHKQDAEFIEGLKAFHRTKYLENWSLAVGHISWLLNNFLMDKLNDYGFNVVLTWCFKTIE